MTAWEKPVRHHKWADELEAEAKVKAALRKAKLAAKKDNHTKRCPYCAYEPVNKAPLYPGLVPDDIDQPKDTYLCPGCDRLYRAKCPGTILLDGNPVVVEWSGW